MTDFQFYLAKEMRRIISGPAKPSPQPPFILSSFYDSRRQIKPNSYERDSENGILFTAEYVKLAIKRTPSFKPLFKDYVAQLLWQLCDYNGNWWTMPDCEGHERNYKTMTSNGKPRRFSLDNALAVMELCKLYDMPYPKFTDIYWHPREIIYFAYLRGNPLGYLFFPLLIPMAAWTFLVDKNETSGQIMWWLRFPWFNPTKWFNGYFPESAHPSRVLCKMIWSKK